MAAVRLQKIKQEYQDAISIRWRAYPLAIVPRTEARISQHSIEGRERANLEPEGIHFNPWPDSESYPVTSLPALRVSVCARQQSGEVNETLHIAIFKAFFEKCRNIENEKVLFGLAAEAGVDIHKLRTDLKNPSVDAEIMADYYYYQDNFLGWGVPLALVGGKYPLAGAVPIEMYRRAINLCLGKISSGD